MSSSKVLILDQYNIANCEKLILYYFKKPGAMLLYLDLITIAS